MPVSTPRFGLQAFVRGDFYSATIDKRRFLTIDNHLAFLSDRIGDGVIDGWTLSDNGSLELECSQGLGIIDRFVTRTFGVYNKSLEDNNTVYVWMRRRPEVIGSFSSFSNLSYLNYLDSSAPSNPSDLLVSGITTETISLRWDENVENDLSFYEVYQSEDGSTYSKIDEVTTNYYVVENLENNSPYYFKITAVDASGNISGFSNVVSAQTDLDLTQPPDPTNLRTINNDSFVQIIWRLAPSNNIAFYRAYVYEVNQEGFDVTSPFIVETDGNQRVMHIRGLDNGQRYRVNLLSVGNNGIESSGVSVYVRPESYAGPADVEILQVSDSVGSNSISNVILNVNWTPLLDAYGEDSIDYFEVKIEELNGSQIIESEWITVLDGLNRDFQVFPILNSSPREYRSIQSRTTYYVTVRSVDSNGLRSKGVVFVYKTRSFIAPSSPLLFQAQQQENQNILVTWQNQYANFDHNAFTFIIKDNSDNSEVTVESETNIFQTEQYIVESDLISANHQYVFRLTSFDEFGHASDTIETIYAIPDTDSLPRPPVPIKQIANAGDNLVYLKWERPENIPVKGYRIWRSLRKVSYEASDFTAIETVISSNGDITEYSDLEVTNDFSYVYFITTINIYDIESKNPEDDEFINYRLSAATPRSASSMPAPSSLVVSQNISDINISWNNTGGKFDGYEIWRSVGNKYSFELIASLPPSDSSYTDESVLTETAKYYYVVRKFYNESDLFITESNVTVSGAIFVGKVVTSDGEMEFFNDDVIYIKDLEDPIRAETINKLADHKHVWNNDNDDRRIDLGNNFIVNDWSTIDYLNYSTEVDITETLDYILYINDEKTNLLHTIDREKGKIVFETRLYRGRFDYGGQTVYPYSEPPVIKVVFDNLPETQGELAKERISGLSSQQVISGDFRIEQIPSLNHQGRMREQLIPEQITLISVDDGYRFTSTSREEIIGEAVVFYDVILNGSNSNDILIASTSKGILVSVDFGLNWSLAYSLPTPALKLFYSSRTDSYFALTNRGVYVSRGGSVSGFSQWEEVGGTENTKIVRDIIQTSDGSVFCTSDIGVFRLERGGLANNFFWQQKPIFGPRSTEAFAIIEDPNEARILVSNELGIFETQSGSNWIFTSLLRDQRPIYSFFVSNKTIFAVSEFMVWRLNANGDSFEKIYETEDNIFRKIVVWKDRIYITSNNGLIVSRPDSNIYSDNEVDFEFTFSQINKKKYVVATSSLNIIDGKLFVGTEKRLYISSSPGRIVLHSEIREGVVPAIYINGVEIKIGVRFSTSQDRRYVCFDEKLGINDVVTVANQFKKYYLKNGGWVDSNYATGIVLYADGVKINDGSIAEKPFNALAQMQTPIYTDRNSHKAGADIAKEDLVSSLLQLLENEQSESGEIVLIGFNKINVSNVARKTERFLSQIYDSGRVITSTNTNGEIVESPFRLPPFRVALLSNNTRHLTYGINDYGLYRNFSTDGSPGLFTTELSEEGQNSQISSDFFGGSVGDLNNIDYSNCYIICLADSVDGSFSFSSELDKYTSLEIDILKVTFDNVSDAHWQVEDRIELVNSGLYSHLSQVQQCNILNVGIFNERNFSGLQNSLSTPYQNKYYQPCNASWYEKLYSTVDNNIEYNSGNAGVSILYPATVFYIEELESVWVGGVGGIISINIETKVVNKIDVFDQYGSLDVISIQRYNNLIYILSRHDLFIYDISSGLLSKYNRDGLPDVLTCFTISLSKILIIGTNEGVFIRKPTQDIWVKAFESEKIHILISPDSTFAIANRDVWYSSDGINWNKTGSLPAGLEINNIVKHRSQINIATSGGLYEDNGSFYTSGISTKLVDIMNDISESSNVVVNEVVSNFNKLVIGLSDGRYIIYETDYQIFTNISLETIHRILLIENDIWLFGLDSFQIAGDERVRRTATGSIIEEINSDTLGGLTNQPE